MRLTIVGGGGFRVPLVYRKLLDGNTAPRCTEVVLHDVDRTRLDAIARVLHQQAAGTPSAPRVRTTTDLDEALRGAAFVCCAIRVGGLDGRIRDERLPLAENLLGQETVGAGGVLYGLRTIPVAMHIAERVAALAPDAWLVNLTNPAGMVTEAMTTVLGARVIGVCDSPAGLCRRVAEVLGQTTEQAWFRYYGLNHLGWLEAVLVHGRDLLPGLLSDDSALASFEEGALFGPEWLRTLGAVPNEYLHYYYFHREAVAAIQRQNTTRGEFLREQQAAFYEAARRDPEHALSEWERVREQREATYMAENRRISGAGARSVDRDDGGYEEVALALIRALDGGRPARLILNVRNHSALPALDPDAVVEVPCLVDTTGAHPCAIGEIDASRAAMLTAVKASERETVAAARTGSRAAALRALVAHPLVDSVPAATRLLDSHDVLVPDNMSRTRKDSGELGTT